ncbi:MAG: hypothetical protein Q9174_002452, partial [Haloplaca sp. 1 TL-2023]
GSTVHHLFRYMGSEHDDGSTSEENGSPSPMPHKMAANKHWTGVANGTIATILSLPSSPSEDNTEQVSLKLRQEARAGIVGEVFKFGKSEDDEYHALPTMASVGNGGKN